MSNAHNLIGKRFGKLSVLSRSQNGRDGKTRWRCRCDCGNEKVVSGVLLVAGHTRSCGCLLEKHYRRLQGRFNEQADSLEEFVKG